MAGSLALGSVAAPAGAQEPAPETATPSAEMQRWQGFAHNPDPEAVAPATELQRWQAKRRSLQIATGLSGGFMAATFVTGATLLAWSFWPRPSDCCDNDAFGESITMMVMLPTAAVLAIPTGVFGAQLRRHERERPSARLRLLPGGLQIQF
ncbi:hypothetical protein OV203_49430 [Nannocystis sp. ILAH1]|uniref:hypothetical protein n=1 Tax=unclassified Nannocystis TaxID=2627009 RepID=UPI002270FC45|nr:MULTISPECIES: hypothetical protein [unclassified Nannocystis]MCY0995247.1 hypothetical protein [Nannocystis sp. ILAH1]MCY1068128.1 hypothetical protein [Nannocystis sp. RBIL2]